MDAWTRTDLDALVKLLKEDAKLTMPPSLSWYAGRDAIARFLAEKPFAPSAPMHVQVPTRANRQPALAVFVQPDAGAPFRPCGITVLGAVGGLIAAMAVSRQPGLVERFAIVPPR